MAALIVPYQKCAYKDMPTCPYGTETEDEGRKKMKGLKPVKAAASCTEEQSVYQR